MKSRRFAVLLGLSAFWTVGANGPQNDHRHGYRSRRSRGSYGSYRSQEYPDWRSGDTYSILNGVTAGQPA